MYLFNFRTNIEVQKNGIALINALYLKADPVKRKVMLSTRLQHKHQSHQQVNFTLFGCGLMSGNKSNVGLLDLCSLPSVLLESASSWHERLIIMLEFTMPSVCGKFSFGLLQCIIC